MVKKSVETWDTRTATCISLTKAAAAYVVAQAEAANMSRSRWVENLILAAMTSGQKRAGR